MDLKKQDIEVLTNLMLDFSKDSGFPFYEKISEASPVNKTIFSNLTKDEYYQNLIKDYVEKKLSASEGTKMGKLLKDKFRRNKELFMKFIILNIKKDFNEEFHNSGKEVQELLNSVESELFKSIEGSQYKDFSSGLYKKYEKLIKSLFPYINNVGVIVRKAF